MFLLAWNSTWLNLSLHYMNMMRTVPQPVLVVIISATMDIRNTGTFLKGAKKITQ